MAVPKLSDKEWGVIRKAWENDPREGFAWIVSERNLTVSAPGVRKKAVKEGWEKQENPSQLPAIATAAAGVVSQRNQKKKPAKPETNPEEERRPFKTRETPLLDELDRTEPKQGLFVREYVKCLNGSLAARRAGYGENSPEVTAARLLSTDKIQACVRELRDELLRGIEAEAKDVLQVLFLQLNADINEISQFRRICCRACYGTKTDDGKHARQYTPLEYEEAKLKHDEKRARLLTRTDEVVDIGEFPSHEGDWYDKRKEPNPDCPECFGEGLGEVYFGDTRKLSKAAKALYGGVKQTRDGIEIIVANREKVIDQLARTLGMFKENISIEATIPSLETLDQLFREGITKADERQRKILIERGLPIDGDFERGS